MPTYHVTYRTGKTGCFGYTCDFVQSYVYTTQPLAYQQIEPIALEVIITMLLTKR